MKAGLGPRQTDTLKSWRRGTLKLQTDLFHGFLYYFLHHLSCSRPSLLSKEWCMHPSMQLHSKKPCLCCYHTGANQCLHRLSPLAGICLVSLPSLPQQSTHLWIQEALGREGHMDPAPEESSGSQLGLFEQTHTRSSTDQRSSLKELIWSHLAVGTSVWEEQSTTPGHCPKGEGQNHMAHRGVVSINSLKVYLILPPSFLSV